MALCHNCDDARIEYIGNGSQTDYSFPFEYNKRDDVEVAKWNKNWLVWESVSRNDWNFQNDTLIRFDKPPIDDQPFIIYRCTDLEPLPAEFHPGHSIKAQDLNDNFFVIKSAIEENRCAIASQYEKAEEKYWNKVPYSDIEEGVKPDVGETVFGNQPWVSTDDAVASTEAIDLKIEEEIDKNKVDLRDVTQGRWIHGDDTNDNDEKFATTAAISERSDNYFQDTRPAKPRWRTPGKIWFDSDDISSRVWDQYNRVWVKTGLSGPPGPTGPTGTYQTIVQDTAPQRRVDNTPLVNGDVWFNSSTAELFIWYDDGKPGNSIRSKQWVQALGGAGEKGEPGGITQVTGIAPIGVTGDAFSPVVSINKATNAAQGSVQLALDPPSIGDLTSSNTNDVLTVPHFNELVGRITSVSVVGVQSVTGDNGVTTSGTSDVTVSGIDATVAVKGVVQLTNTVTTDTTLAVTGTAVESFAVPLNLSILNALP